MSDSVDSILPSRRSFLATTGLAAAAASLPQIVTAQKAEGKKLRIGIIGCGGRGRVVGDTAIKDGRYEIAAVADYFKDAADNLGEKFKVPANRRYNGIDCFKKMIEAGELDICAVLSPPYFHPEQVEAAVEAGLHIWLAKPIAVDAVGVARIEAAAKKAASKSRCFLVDFQTRAFEHYHEAARRVAAGDMGVLGWGEIEGTCPAFDLRTEQNGGDSKLKNWLQWKDLCGESIIEFSIHSIDLASLMIGRKPISASGYSGRFLLDHLPDGRKSDVRDHWVITYDYGEGCKVMFRGKRIDGHNLPDHHGLYCKLHGTLGSLETHYNGPLMLRADNGKSFYGDRYMVKEMGMKKPLHSIYVPGIARNLETFHKNITEGDFTQATVAPSIDSHYLALLGRDAGYANGKVVTWDEAVANKKVMSFDTSGLKS